LDGHYFVSGHKTFDNKGEVRFWENNRASKADVTKRFNVTGSKILQSATTCVEYNDDGTLVAFGDEKGKVFVSNTLAGIVSVTEMKPAPGQHIRSLSFFRDTTTNQTHLVAACGVDETACTTFEWIIETRDPPNVPYHSYDMEDLKQTVGHYTIGRVVDTHAVKSMYQDTGLKQTSICVTVDVNINWLDDDIGKKILESHSSLTGERIRTSRFKIHPQRAFDTRCHIVDSVGEGVLHPTTDFLELSDWSSDVDDKDEVGNEEVPSLELPPAMNPLVQGSTGMQPTLLSTPAPTESLASTPVPVLSVADGRGTSVSFALDPSQASTSAPSVATVSVPSRVAVPAPSVTTVPAPVATASDSSRVAVPAPSVTTTVPAPVATASDSSRTVSPIPSRPPTSAPSRATASSSSGATVSAPSRTAAPIPSESTVPAPSRAAASSTSGATVSAPSRTATPISSRPPTSAPSRTAAPIPSESTVPAPSRTALKAPSRAAASSSSEAKVSAPSRGPTRVSAPGASLPSNTPKSNVSVSSEVDQIFNRLWGKTKDNAS
jgi:hypothetical protein